MSWKKHKLFYFLFRKTHHYFTKLHCITLSLTCRERHHTSLHSSLITWDSCKILYVGIYYIYAKGKCCEMRFIYRKYWRSQMHGDVEMIGSWCDAKFMPKKTPNEAGNRIVNEKKKKKKLVDWEVIVARRMCETRLSCRSAIASVWDAQSSDRKQECLTLS